MVATDGRSTRRHCHAAAVAILKITLKKFQPLVAIAGAAAVVHAVALFSLKKA